MTDVATPGSDATVTDPPAGGDQPAGTQVITAEPPPPPGDASWRDGLGGDLKGNKSLEKFKDVSAVAQAYVDLEKSSSRGDKITIPGKDATDAEKEAFWSKIGRPPEASGYEQPTAEMPADVKMNDEEIAGFQKLAHELGLSKSQYAALVRFDAVRKSGEMEGTATARAAFAEESEATLRKEYGDAFDERQGMANFVLKEYGGKDAQDLLVETGMCNHPVMFRMLVKFAEAVGQDEIIGGGHRRSYDKTPDEAKEEIGRLQTDEGFMKVYVDKHAPGHNDAVQRMLKLQEAIHGNEVLGKSGGEKYSVTG